MLIHHVETPNKNLEKAAFEKKQKQTNKKGGIEENYFCAGCDEFPPVDIYFKPQQAKGSKEGKNVFPLKQIIL